MGNANTITAESLFVDFASRDPASQHGARGRAIEIYRRWGCFLAKGFFTTEELSPSTDYIRQLIALRMEHAGIVAGPEEDGLHRFDDGFLQMSRCDRRHGAAIFDACRRLLPLHELSVDPRLVGLAKALMGTETVMASDVKAIRVDHPNEDTYLFDWHQDYPYTMDSEDAIVCWIPMQDVDQRNGCLRMAPGSNELGLLPVRVHDLRNRQNNKQAFMEIAHKTLVDRYAQLQVPACAGDVLVFSTFTLHASQPNRSSRARWTAQVRFGNFAHPKAVARDWPGSLRDGSWFDDKHPEYVVNLSDFGKRGPGE